MFPLCNMFQDNRIFLSLKYTVHNPFRNKQVCPKIINVIMENNLLHRSGAKSTLCNVAIKVYPLSLHILIRTPTFFWL